MRNNSFMAIGVIIVAAGRSVRLGGRRPKQYRSLAGKPVLERTVSCFLSCPEISAIQVVIHPDDYDVYQDVMAATAAADSRIRPPVTGGDTRQSSVFEGVRALDDVDTVLVHDAARPFVSEELLQRALIAGRSGIASIPGIGVTDTIKRISNDDVVLDTPAREELRAVQTPQVFKRAELLNAHERAAREARVLFPDDGALMEWAGYPVQAFSGDPANVKLTFEDDFLVAEARLRGEQNALVSRSGIGFDVHAMCPGDHIWLGGIRIPHIFGVEAHSDGDVVLHALTDAILGALAEGDIGTHFPPSDLQWRDASSDQFLAFARKRVTERGGIIDHLDVVVMCEAPRLGPHRTEIRQRIAQICHVRESKISVKATTTERLGFVGRQEGIAAQAIATIRLPGDS